MIPGLRQAEHGEPGLEVIAHQGPRLRHLQHPRHITGRGARVERHGHPARRDPPPGPDPVGVGPLTVRATRWHSGELIIRFDGVRDRTAAAELRGTWLSVDSGTLDSPDDPDEFRDHELVGLSVRTTSGSIVGVVTDET